MSSSSLLPDPQTMFRAFVERDASFEGIFVVGVRTTGIFCRPSCPARPPNPENVEFFPRAGDALAAGYRPCQRCRPLEPKGAYPDWLKPLMQSVEADPARRWTTADLEAAGVDPARVRRWFQAAHGMTFLAYLRARRLGRVFSRLRAGEELVDLSLAADFDSLSGFCDALRRRTGSSPTAAREQRALQVMQLPSPLGPLLLAGDDAAVHLVEFWDRRMLETQFSGLEERLGAVFFPGSTAPLRQLADELAEYFAGQRRVFTAPLALTGTPHQEAVWRGLRVVPFGETWSYRELASHLGRPTAVRAVARAVGENRLAIVVPCHRIVGTDGQLTGYGGGLWRKRHLLALEGGAETTR